MNANQPAYPQDKITSPYSDLIPISGLTKLELLSAMAMQGILASPHAVHNDAIWIAATAKSHAKALLAELEEEGK